MEQVAKGLVQSKVFWLAALQAFAGAVVIFQTSYPELGWLALVKSVVDIALRMYTTQPVSGIMPK